MTDEEINEQEIDRFEARLFGTLSEAGSAAFDAELERDAALRERYDLFVLSVRGIQAVDASRSDVLSDRFKAIDRELDGKEVIVRPHFTPWMGWAAAVLVILGGAGLWWSSGPDSLEELALEFTVPEPGLPVLMGVSSRAMDAIMNAYKQDDMSVASALLDAALLADGANDTLNYFRAVVYDRANKPSQAMGFYDRVPANSAFHVRAMYRTAMVRLRSGDVEGARQSLDAVALSGDVVLAAKALELIDRLRQR